MDYLRAYIGWIVGGIAVVAFFALFLAINKPWIPAVKWKKTSGDMEIALAPVGPFGSLQGLLVETKGDAYPICTFRQEQVNWRSTTCSHCGKSFRWVTTRCPACDGTGICSSCDGSGKAVSEMRGEKTIIGDKCPFCKGNSKCHLCEGDGVFGNKARE